MFTRIIKFSKGLFSTSALTSVAVMLLFFGFASTSSAGQYLRVTPDMARPGEPFAITITAPAAGGAFRCVASPTDGTNCSDPSRWAPLSASGTDQASYTVPANRAAGTITYELHLYANRDVNTELLTYRDTATLTILASNIPPPATVTPIPSDLDCPIGLPKDTATGLCLPTNPLTPAASSIVGASTVGQLIQRILDILLTLAGVVAILFIVIGGYQYITSRGAEDQAKAGRKTMTYAIIGLVAILLAYTGVNLVVRLITTGTLFG